MELVAKTAGDFGAKQKSFKPQTDFTQQQQFLLDNKANNLLNLKAKLPSLF